MDFNNFVRLDGNLTHAPTFRVTKGGTSVVNFRMATNQRRKSESGVWESIPTYHNCTAWGKQAEVIRDKFNVGDGIKVTGSIEHGEYTKDNVRHSTTTINVDSWDFGFKPKKDKGQSDHGEQSGNDQPSQQEIDEANTLAAQASSNSNGD